MTLCKLRKYFGTEEEKMEALQSLQFFMIEYIYGKQNTSKEIVHRAEKTISEIKP